MVGNNLENKFPYSGIPTFYKYPGTTILEDIDIAIVGIPFDHGTANARELVSALVQ